MSSSPPPLTTTTTTTSDSPSSESSNTSGMPNQNLEKIKNKMSTPAKPSELWVQDHARLAKRGIEFLPMRYEAYDPKRMNLLFFSLNTLDVLNCLDEYVSPKKRQSIIDWVYSCQIPQRENSKPGKSGFLPSPWLGLDDSLASDSYKVTNSAHTNKYASGHLTFSFTALAILRILKDNLERCDRKGCARLVAQCQTSEGSFLACPTEKEADMRYMYSAIAICGLLNDFSSINKESAIAFIKSCQRYDGAFAQRPYQEAHGGSTYCAVASLTLLGAEIPQKSRIIKWCLDRQVGGYCGRCNKIPDVCYSYWIGATLELLQSTHLVNRKLILDYTFASQKRYAGGFSKWPSLTPDPLHTHHALFGMSILDGYKGLKKIDCRLTKCK